ARSPCGRGTTRREASSGLKILSLPLTRTRLTARLGLSHKGRGETRKRFRHLRVDRAAERHDEARQDGEREEPPGVEFRIFGAAVDIHLDLAQGPVHAERDPFLPLPAEGRELV